eukprot:TRINITY_DN4513_c0_g1_i1.p2 TRINITY_DN4513_c0_g1~~TRINITY_DN4513_c0_g1_i1.p2  ORF type:complete len:102 (+),score=13.45 TRINITY_DN4513_c0_g1_i1:165-470(+)
MASFCSQRGRVLSVHSNSMNREAQDICKTVNPDYELCYIGFERNNDDSFVWHDTTEIDYLNWDQFQPSKWKVPLETSVVISSEKWQVEGFGTREACFAWNL